MALASQFGAYACHNEVLLCFISIVQSCPLTSDSYTSKQVYISKIVAKADVALKKRKFCTTLFLFQFLCTNDSGAPLL